MFIVSIILTALILHTHQQEAAPLPEWLVFSQQPKLNIQILEPSGIQVWTRYNSKYHSFGVELFVNPTGGKSRCDLCRNASRPVDGKFLIQDDSLLVRLGDTIKYRVVKVKRHEVKWSSWKYVFVGKELFYNSERYCTSQCETSKDIIKAKNLERYIENMLTNCALAHTSEQLFFPLDQASTLVANAEYFVKTRLYSIELLRPLVDHVEQCYVSVDGVGFKMRSILEKLKILEASRDRLDIVDYDDYFIVPITLVPQLEKGTEIPQI